MAKCAICRHRDVALIEADLDSGILSARRIARKYGVHRTQLRRHRLNHMGFSVKHGSVLRPSESTPTALTVPAWEPPRPEPPSTRARDLDPAVDRAARLERRVERVLDQAEERGNPDLVLRAAKEKRAALELTAKLTGETKQAEVAAGGLAGGEPLRVVMIRDFATEDEGGTQRVIKYQGKTRIFDHETGPPTADDGGGEHVVLDADFKTVQ